jgi:hypothetical protein
MELKELLNGVLGMVLNMPEQEVSSLYSEDGNPKEDALDTLKSKFSERVKADREKAELDRKAQRDRGRKERGMELEKALKEAGVDIGDAIGEEAVQKLREHIDGQVQAVSKPGELDDEKVKAHKLYRDLERKAAMDLKAKEEEYKKAWTDRDAKEQRERILSEVKSKAKTQLDELRPYLSEDPKKAANQLKSFYRDLEEYTYEMDGEEVVVKDKEGNRVENDLHQAIGFGDLVKRIADDYYDFQVSDKKGSAGDVTKGTKEAIKLQKPTTRDQYAVQLAAITDDPNLSAKDRSEKIDVLKKLAADLV